MIRFRTFTSDFWQTYIPITAVKKYLATDPSLIAVNTSFSGVRSGQFTIRVKHKDSVQILPVAEMEIMADQSPDQTSQTGQTSQINYNLKPNCRFKIPDNSNYKQSLSYENINALDLLSIYKILLSANSGWQEYAKYQILTLIDELISFNTQLLFNLVSFERELVELTWLYSYLVMNLCLLFPESYHPNRMIAVDFRDIQCLDDVYNPSKRMKIQRLTELNWSYLDILKKYFERMS